MLVSALGARYETKATSLSQLKEGDRIMASTSDHKKTFAVVRKLPHSQSTEAFVEIGVLEADGAVDEHLLGSEQLPAWFLRCPPPSPWPQQTWFSAATALVPQ